MTNHCSICEGSGKVDLVTYKLLPPWQEITKEVLGTKNCPGCDGTGVSLAAKIKNGDAKPPEKIDVGAICSEVISENQKIVEQIKGGKTKLINKLVGAVMQKTSSRADPKTVNETLTEMLK